MTDEPFDGSALRELLIPAVADRGRSPAPTDAIVAAGRRRVLGRRGAVAGGALAIVAAVPLAASAIAAGPGTATSAAGTAHTPAGAAAPTRTSAPAAPTHSGAPTHTTMTQPPGGIPPKPTLQPPAAGGLPSTPTTLASGTVEGRQWSVDAVTVPGNNALTAGQQCLGLVITVDGRVSSAGGAPTIAYCLPMKTQASYPWAYQDTLQYDYKNGAGTLQMGMLPAGVAKVVAHVDGLAPVSADTVPAPGDAAHAFYFLPIPKDQGFRVSFDEYDAQGGKIGTFNNWTLNPTGQGK